MPLVYSCILPHSPALIPGIGKEHTEKFIKTRTAFDHVRSAMMEAAVETVVVIAPHAHDRDTASITLHVPMQYRAHFTQFGDLGTTFDCPSDPVLSDQMKQALSQGGFTVHYDSHEDMEYSAAVPLWHFRSKWNPKVVVLHPGSFQDLKEYLKLGALLCGPLQRSQERIGCIASGDLSHCLSEQAPAPFHAGGVKFDQDIIKMIKVGRIKKIIKIDTEAAAQFGVCGLPPIITLLGLLEHINASPEILSYEAHLGVGLLTVEYTI